MQKQADRTFVAFDGTDLIARGRLQDVALRAKAAEVHGRVAFYEDDTGRVIDVDLRGSAQEVSDRLTASSEVAPARRKRGRPKLGVVSREVSLLPRHWAWLEAQPRTASATLRRLIDQARRDEGSQAQTREAVDAAHRFLWDLVGDAPGFEEACRALFAHDFAQVREHTADWPPDVREQLERFLSRAG